MPLFKKTNKIQQLHQNCRSLFYLLKITLLTDLLEMSSTRLVVCSVIFSLLFIEGVLSRDPRRGAGGSTTLGGDVFLQGKYLEVAINPAGSFGSRLPPGAYAWGGNQKSRLKLN
jgi:hypothetical protein